MLIALGYDQPSAERLQHSGDKLIKYIRSILSRNTMKLLPASQIRCWRRASYDVQHIQIKTWTLMTDHLHVCACTHLSFSFNSGHKRPMCERLQRVSGLLLPKSTDKCIDVTGSLIMPILSNNLWRNLFQKLPRPVTALQILFDIVWQRQLSQAYETPIDRTQKTFILSSMA